MGVTKSPQSFSLTNDEVKEVDSLAKKLGFRNRGALVLAWVEATEAIPLIPILDDNHRVILRPAKEPELAKAVAKLKGESSPSFHRR